MAESIPSRLDFYNMGGVNRDTNPFQMRQQDLLDCRNMYAHQFGAKKVRPGYATYLNAVDAQPVRNLIYVAPTPLTAKGFLYRISNKFVYPYAFTGSNWLSSILTQTVDQWTGNTSLAGANGMALHLDNSTDAYSTIRQDGINTLNTYANGSANRAHFLTAWRSRVFSDTNSIRFTQSAIGFDINYTDPWLQSTTDPAAAGAVLVDDAGNGGAIIGMTTTIDRVMIYRRNSVYRYNGGSILRLPFADTIIGNPAVSMPICHYAMGDYDYFLSTKGIMKVDSNGLTPASFGINTIIEDTFNSFGITAPVPFNWGYLTGFFIGTLKVGQDTVTNGMLVHDERFDEWYIWSLANQMTSFCCYSDPVTGANTLISGDINGVTYKWGEQYGSDNGASIGYRLRTKYHDFGSIESTKTPDRIIVSAIYGGGEATISLAYNYSDQYNEIAVATGFLKKATVTDKVMGASGFNTISLEMSGSTTNFRPEVYGWTLKLKDEGEQMNSSNSKN